jgi:hypothetical protein
VVSLLNFICKLFSTQRLSQDNLSNTGLGTPWHSCSQLFKNGKHWSLPERAGLALKQMSPSAFCTQPHVHSN